MMKRMTLKELYRAGFRDTVDHETFLSQENRDKRFNELEKLHKNDHDIYFRKTSLSNQRLHPMYIRDANQFGLGEAAADSGFGNTSYMIMHKKLYKIEKWAR